MAIAVNWITGVITVPKADTTLVQSTPNEIRTLDIDTFRLTLRDLEEDLAGRPWPRTHDHNTEVTVSGITLARVISILPPYTVTFEDGQYTVRLTGANSNIGDRLNANQVSVQSSNSAGLIDLGTIATRIFELWQEKGLDIDNALIVSATNRSFGDVSQTISGTDTVTVQRD